MLIVCLEEMIKLPLYTITDEKATIEKAQISGAHCVKTVPSFSSAPGHSMKATLPSPLCSEEELQQPNGTLGLEVATFGSIPIKKDLEASIRKIHSPIKTY